MLVSETINPYVNKKPSGFIKFKKDPRELKSEHPFFRTLTFGKLANGLQQANANKNLFTNGKLDIDKFHKFLVERDLFKPGITNKVKLVEILKDISIILGFVDSIKFSKADKQEVKMKDKAMNGELPLSDFDNAEIDPESAIDSDIVIRNNEGGIETKYYRFDRKLSKPEINMLKVSWAFRYGDPEKTTWSNYLNARPATYGHIIKHGKSLEQTVDPYRNIEYTD